MACVWHVSVALWNVVRQTSLCHNLLVVCGSPVVGVVHVMPAVLVICFARCHSTIESLHDVALGVLSP